MIIHAPSLSHVGSDIQVSARVEFQNPKRGIPSELWFRFANISENNLSIDADPFAVALLLLAMQNNEPLILQSSLSQKLYTGLMEYQRIYHSWFPDRFHLIEIRALNLRKDPPRTEETSPSLSNVQTACAFSGGVDSFYTLLTLKGITHAIFMAGFDMPLNLKASIHELTSSYSLMMKDLGIHFVVGSTNIRNFVNPVDWTNAHGQALGATALFFKTSWSTFYIPSSYVDQSYPKWGTHPLLDPLLSTETLNFVHHGSHANRIQKLATLVQFPMTYERLRVCWIQDIGLKNCGRCEKCVRTQIALNILDSLPRYTPFKHAKNNEGLTRTQIRSLSQRTHQARLFAQELLWAAIRKGKLKTAFDLAYSLIKREIFYLRFRLPTKRKVRTD